MQCFSGGALRPIPHPSPRRLEKPAHTFKARRVAHNHSPNQAAPAVATRTKKRAKKSPPGGVAGEPLDPNLGDKSGGFGRVTNYGDWINRLVLPLRSPCYETVNETARTVLSTTLAAPDAAESPRHAIGLRSLGATLNA